MGALEAIDTKLGAGTTDSLFHSTEPLLTGTKVWLQPTVPCTLTTTDDKHHRARHGYRRQAG